MNKPKSWTKFSEDELRAVWPDHATNIIAKGATWEMVAKLRLETMNQDDSFVAFGAETYALTVGILTGLAIAKNRKEPK